MSKILLGVKARDSVTNFEGTVTARVEYITGCVQYCITPGIDKDGKLRDSHYFDEDRLEVVKKNASKIEKKKAGGHQNPPPTK